jgi:hypothetical protein
MTFFLINSIKKKTEILVSQELHDRCKLKYPSTKLGRAFRRSDSTSSANTDLCSLQNPQQRAEDLPPEAR